MNTKLMQALNTEAKHNKQDQIVKIERDFICRNWSMFGSDKWAIIGAMKTDPEANGDDLIELMGLTNVHIRKVALSELLSFCYRKNKLFNLYIEEAIREKPCTYFFVAGKTAIVITNKTVLKPYKQFMHKLEVESSPDIYWAAVDDVKGFTVY